MLTSNQKDIIYLMIKDGNWVNADRDLSEVDAIAKIDAYKTNQLQLIEQAVTEVQMEITHGQDRLASLNELKAILEG